MANLITSPRFWKNKALLFKAETVYGTDPTPSGSTDWIEARNVNFQPYDAETVERNIDMPYMGGSGKVVVERWAKASFDVYMGASGTAGTAPKWADLMLACGTAETVVAATSVSYELVSTGIKSITAWINVDGVYHKLSGGRGTVSGKIDAKGVPMLSFEFDFIYSGPVAAAMPSVTRTGWAMDVGANAANTTALTLGATSLAVQSMDFALGNSIARLSLMGPQHEVMITNRAPTLNVTVAAPALGDFNPFALADGGASQTLEITHGLGAGKQIKLTANALLNGVEYGEIEGLLGYRLSFLPTPVLGNDELAIVCL
ncbi:MAG: hypothetical protein KBD39_11115 [Sterolibacterium sp.]|jgi:hypothetical protein|nr:hypothetical protein [Sterolibacterium sp.]